jgi:hypothetical protein
MAGSRNNTHYGAGYSTEPTTAADIVTMQLTANSTQTINVPSDPEGVYASNPGSVAEGRDGTLWLKVTGTGNTGWQRISTGGTVAQTVTTQNGTATASSNNFNYNGYPQVLGSPQIGQTHASGSTFTYEDRTWITAFVVDPSSTVSTRGTYQTIGAALTDATSGTMIYIRPGSYTENLTLKAGVGLANLIPASVRDSGSRVLITGSHTIPSSGAPIDLYGIRFQNNGNYIIDKGTSTCTVNFIDCYVEATNFAAIRSTGTGDIFFYNCTCDIASNSVAFMTSSNGVTWFIGCLLSNSSASTVANSISGQNIILRNCISEQIFNTSSTGYLQASQCQWGTAYSPFQNNTWITTAGTATTKLFNCQFYSGTASCISIGSGSTVEAYNILCSTTNANVITGAGTLIFGLITFAGSSSNINVTTQTPAISGPFLDLVGTLNTFPVQRATVTQSSTNTNNTLYELYLKCSGTPTANFGPVITMYGDDASNNKSPMAVFGCSWETATSGSEVSRAYLRAYRADVLQPETIQAFPDYGRLPQGAVFKYTAPGAYPYTVLVTDYTVGVDTTSARTINMPTTRNTGQTFRIKDVSANAGTNNITIQGNGVNIVGTTSASSYVISVNGASVDIMYNGSVWLIL